MAWELSDRSSFRNSNVKFSVTMQSNKIVSVMLPPGNIRVMVTVKFEAVVILYCSLSHAAQRICPSVRIVSRLIRQTEGCDGVGHSIPSTKVPHDARLLI